MMRYTYGIDWGTLLYYLGIIVAVISLFLSIKVNGTFNRISRYANVRNISGQEAARRILSSNGLGGIVIQPVGGTLSDNYNPANKTLNLSTEVLSGKNIAAVAVAAHECGHAIQDAEQYRPMLTRSKLVPAANLGSRFGIIIFLAGLLLSRIGLTFLMDIGIALFSFAVLFHIVTLGVEFDASRRGLDALTSTGILCEEELPKARKMLRVAAYTYVASMASSVIQLLRLMSVRSSSRR